MAAVSPESKAFRWAGRVFFVAAVGAATWTLWSRARARPAPELPQSVRVAPVKIDWERERFETWKNEEWGFSLLYPARFEPVRGFGRFTSRPLQDGIEESDLVAFRSSKPRSVIVVASYRSPKPLSWDGWIALAEAPVYPARPGQPAVFATEFGDGKRTVRRIRVQGRDGLAVTAQGGVKYPIRGNEAWELWRFESRFFAEGDRALRVTAGVHLDQYDSSRAAVDRVLGSLRIADFGLRNAD